MLYTCLSQVCLQENGMKKLMLLLTMQAVVVMVAAGPQGYPVSRDYRIQADGSS